MGGPPRPKPTKRPAPKGDDKSWCDGSKACADFDNAEDYAKFKADRAAKEAKEAERKAKQQ